MWPTLGRTARRCSNLLQVLTTLPAGGASPLENRWTALISLRDFTSHPEGPRSVNSGRQASTQLQDVQDLRSSQNLPAGLTQTTGLDLSGWEVPQNDGQLYAVIKRLETTPGKAREMVQRVDHTLSEWEEEGKSGPSAQTLVTYLTAITKSELTSTDFDVKEFLWRLSLDFGTIPTSDMYACALSIAGKGATDPADVLALLHSMSERKEVLAWRHFVVCFDIFARQANLEAAVSLVEQMEWSALRREDAADAEARSIVRSLCALAAAVAQRDSLSEALDLLAACHRFKPPRGSAFPATLQEVVQEAVERDSLADALRGVAMLQEDAEAGLLALDEGQCLGLLSFACLRRSKQLARSAWHILHASLKPRPTGVLDPRRKPRKPLLATYQAYIHALAAVAEFEQAFDIVAEMQEAHPGAPTSWYQGLQPLVDNLARNQHDINAAHKIIEGRLSQGKAVSSAMTDCVLAAAGQMKCSGLAFELFDSFTELQLRPTADTYAAILYGCSRNDMLESVPMILQEMEEKQVPPNAKLLSMIAYCHIVLRDALGAEKVLQDMRSLGHKPGLELVEQAVMRCEREGATEATARLMHLVGPHSWRVFASRNKINRWSSSGGMLALTGTDAFRARPIPTDA